MHVDMTGVSVQGVAGERKREVGVGADKDESDLDAMSPGTVGGVLG